MSRLREYLNTVTGLPPNPDPDRLPLYGDRRQLAQIHTQYFGPISNRTLEDWPLEWRRVNGRAVSEMRAFLAEAKRRFDAAPVIRGGRDTGQRKTA